MDLSFWPTWGFDLWPFAAVIVVFVPVSIVHERNFRRVIAAYATARAEDGAAADGVAIVPAAIPGTATGTQPSAQAEPTAQWPPRALSRMLGLQPALLMLLAVLLGWMTATAIAGVLVWPHALPYFNLAINYYDRPYVWVFGSIGAALTVALAAVAIDLWRSPWARVASNLRHAIYASPQRRAALLADALANDPGVRRLRSSGEDAATARS